MALIWFDGFNESEEYTMGRYNMIPPVAQTSPGSYINWYNNYGRFGGGAYQITSSYSYAWMGFENFNTSDPTIIIGFALLVNEPSPKWWNTGHIRLFDTSGLGTLQLGFTLDPTWRYVVYRGGTTWIATGHKSVPYNTWVYHEIKVYFHQTDGTIEIRQNGEPILTKTGLDTMQSGNAYCRAARFYCVYDDRNTRYTDMYICDGSGSEHNDFLGDCRVVSLRPNAPGNYTDLTPNPVVANHLNVDDGVGTDDGNTSYNYSDIVGEKDSYNIGSLPYSPCSILGLRNEAHAMLSAPGDTRFRLLTRVDGNDYFSGVKYPGVGTYGFYTHMMVNNPDDDSAWEEADVNNLEIGLEIGSSSSSLSSSSSSSSA